MGTTGILFSRVCLIFPEMPGNRIFKASYFETLANNSGNLKTFSSVKKKSGLKGGCSPWAASC